MKLSIRHLAVTLSLSCILFQSSYAAIDRMELVQRHNVQTFSIDPEAAVSVGNGDFAFTVDITGLQTLPQLYHDKGIPLETLSSWAWQSWPNPKGLTLQDSMKEYPFYGRSIRYPSLQSSEAGAYFRENPHPVALGQVGFLIDGQPIAPEQITKIQQTLDLWSGIIHSKWEIAGEPVEVFTAVDSKSHTIVIDATSALIANGRLTLQWAFPLSYDTSVKNKPPFIWDQDEQHQTALEASTPDAWLIRRNTLGCEYWVEVACRDAVFTSTSPHHWNLSAKETDHLTLTTSFASSLDLAYTLPADVFANSSEGWQHYWMQGGMVQLNQSTDPRALELERRIILSQYLMRINYAGSVPPGETGLTHLSWYGKHNSEVYIVHAAQWYQWGRTEFLEKGLKWYQDILPEGKKVAQSEGFKGVRWPKMSGIDGRPGPGTINPFIIWNQPNPIYLCELVYRSNPTEETLRTYADLVFESADFLASYAQKDAETGYFNLGPPIKAVTESTGENQTRNPTFELAYWYFTLGLANEWKARLGQPPVPEWKEVQDGLAPLPQEAGKYLEIESFRGLYETGQPVPNSMILAYGLLPATAKVDPALMHHTIDAVTNSHPDKLGRWVSWALGMSAMTYARLGEAETATTIVTNTEKTARFMPSGHVRRPAEPEGCVAYLPVNASFLEAVALMAAGWDTSEGDAPGFPKDGSWVVEWEGLQKMP